MNYNWDIIDLVNDVRTLEKMYIKAIIVLK